MNNAPLKAKTFQFLAVFHIKFLIKLSNKMCNMHGSILNEILQLKLEPHISVSPHETKAPQLLRLLKY